MGTWSSAAEYVNNTSYIDIVEHDGSGYLCKLTATNQEPPNSTYWDLIVSKGDTGDTGDTGAAGPSGSDAPQVQSEYSSDNSNWHSPYQTGDSYIRFSYDGGSTFGTGMLFKGTDGTGSGDVTGPASSTDSSLAAFDGTTGKAIKDSGQTLAELTAAIKLAIYPVGSVYTSVDSTSPATLFGGTWEAFGEGRALVGFKNGDSDFGTAEGTCGYKTHTLTESEIPSHTHAQNSHSHSVDHDHGSFASGSNSADHTHSFSETSGNAGGHLHSIWWGEERPISLSSGEKEPPANTYSSTGYRTGYASGSVYEYAMNAKAVSDHTHSVSGTTANNSAGHTHSVDPPAYNGSSGSETASNQSTGGGSAHSNIQPSITVYMWKRTA